MASDLWQDHLDYDKAALSAEARAQNAQAFWRELGDEMMWRAAARQMVRGFMAEGLTPFDAIVATLRQSRAQGVVLDQLRNWRLRPKRHDKK